MTLKTRSVAIATGTVVAAAALLLGWQLLARRPAGDGAAAPEHAATSATSATSASGVVTATPRRVASAERPATSPAPTVLAEPASVPSSSPAPARRASAASSPSADASGAAGAPVRHRIAARPGAPRPLLPTEVNTAVARALGPRALEKYVYLEPLARRFVASVDALGRQAPPTELWLLRPAPGRLQPGRDERLTAANARRYAGFVAWVEAMPSDRLLVLYARLYPLLQQTYVELGHPQGYFNDRLIEVIDQLLATPLRRTPPRLKPAAAPAPAGLAARPRYEFEDPQLEQLSTGQKLLLRVGPRQAERLKAKLRELRRGLIALGRP